MHTKPDSIESIDDRSGQQHAQWFRFSDLYPESNDQHQTDVAELHHRLDVQDEDNVFMRLTRMESAKHFIAVTLFATDDNDTTPRLTMHLSALMARALAVELNAQAGRAEIHEGKP